MPVGHKHRSPYPKQDHKDTADFAVTGGKAIRLPQNTFSLFSFFHYIRFLSGPYLRPRTLMVAVR